MFKLNIICLYCQMINMKTLEKLSDQVAKKIRQDIDQHKYKAGEKIPAEPELMKLYGVGRSTIREAIKTLSMTGVLMVQQGSGTFVNTDLQNETIDQQLKRADFDEINAVRKLLEDETVKLAAKNHTGKDLEEMKQSLENRRQAIRNEQRQLCVDADIAFHIAIARASSNKALADLYQSFTIIIRDFFSKREVRGITDFAMSHHLHEQLFEAIKSKKEKQAQQVLDKIIENNY
ncbi:MAG: transcriptional regulator [Mucilaginibacter sp.]|nr:transcriptional regulator [Mucilaginibacter sp.]